MIEFVHQIFVYVTAHSLLICVLDPVTCLDMLRLTATPPPPPAIFLLLEFVGDVLASQHVGHAIIGPVIVSRAQARQSGALPHAQFSSVDILSRREGECVLD